MARACFQTHTDALPALSLLEPQGATKSDILVTDSYLHLEESVTALQRIGSCPLSQATSINMVLAWY
jgi:hypothetical protein